MNGEIQPSGDAIDFSQNGSHLLVRPRDVIIKTNEKFSDSYDLYEILGRGCFGKVYLCKEKSTQLNLAAKCIRLTRDSDRKKVEKEVAIMSKLQHRFITQLYDAFATSSRDIILVMELIQGGELFLRVIDEDFNLTESAVALIVYQICEAVQYIHGKDIVHLDLNPQNLMLVFPDNILIKLIDFGLAQHYDGKQELVCMVGSPEFCAPEIVKYEPLSYHTDMWSLGIIVYLLLSGVSPFYDDNEDVIPIKVSKGEWEFIEEFDEFSDEARDFVSKLLVIDKSQRMLPTACLTHPWLAAHHEKFKNIEELRAPTEGKMVDTEKLKKYVKNKKFRKTVFGVMFANRVSKTIGVLKAASSRLKRSMSLRKLSKDDEPSSTSDRISACTAELDFKTENEAQAEATEIVKPRRHETCSINVDVTSHAKIS